MSGVFARILAQGVMFGVSVLTKTFQQAYAKAQAGGGRAAGAAGGKGGAAAAAVASGRMPLDMARQVLNLEKGEVTREAVVEMYTKYYGLNDPDKGGSFYIQAKVASARDALLADLKAREGRGKEGKEAEMK
jgi:hypothetical protein